MFDHCIYFNTTALARTLEREWTVAYKPFGLTPPQGFMLRAVLAKPGIVQSELASELAISRSTATRTLDGLQKLMLVERRLTQSDGRETALHPTKDALQIKDQLNAASAAVTRRLKAEMGEACFVATVTSVKEARSSID
ncbi:MarR family transcriptional regulator [Caballeronia sordidicola]|uniref:MarR family transcriptional regulator n=1 Tax=Caballeronia sordidicola TaxID=196367 RepID=A0A158H9Y3_CABSO|nr:MarR family transcriptional regulator [Caballeronia sordidicola]SAL40947.1 MarR family transcriptional regulator [Caballeronia sordidicola]